MLKWILCLTPIISFCQTTDTFRNAIATASAIDLSNNTGSTNEGHLYAWASKLNVSTAGVYSNAQIVKFDLTTKRVTEKTFVNNQQGVGWTSKKTFSGTVLSTRGTGTREVWEMDFKQAGDSIGLLNLGNSGICNDAFAYSYSYGRDSSIGIGNSSSNCDNTGMAILYKNTHVLVKVAGCDSSLDYTYHVVKDIDNWVYEQVGQSVYRIWAKNIVTGAKKLLLQRNDVFMDLSAWTNGVFAYRSDQNKLYLLSNGDTTLVSNNYNKGTLIDIRETRSNNESFSNTYPYVSAYYDSPKNKFYFATNPAGIYNPTNTVEDSINYNGGVVPKGIANMWPDRYDSNVLVYVGNPYGYIQKYFIRQDSVATYGYPGLNVYSVYQKDAHTWYFSGYPSGTCVKWVDTAFFTAETWYNGAYRAVSATTNPKLIGYFATYAGMDHANDLTLVNGKYLCAAGNDIRDIQSASVGAIDITKDSMYGWGIEHMNLKSWVDIIDWNDKLIFSTSNANGGTPYLYFYNPATNIMYDSLSFGFHTYGKVFVIGDLLIGIAQDTSNATQTIDSTIFYKVNLSTKKLSYYKKVRGTIHKALWMPDGYIGVNFTIRANPAAPEIVSPIPNDFYLTRNIENMDYRYGFNGDYYCVPSSIVRHNNLSTYIINAETAEGKQKILQQWLR